MSKQGESKDKNMIDRSSCKENVRTLIDLMRKSYHHDNEIYLVAMSRVKVKIGM